MDDKQRSLSEIKRAGCFFAMVWKELHKYISELLVKQIIFGYIQYMVYVK